MIRFCGQETCTIDANGRIRLSPRFAADFQHHGGDVVLHCLPEGAMGVYPVSLWLQMRPPAAPATAAAVQSLVVRRQLRRFGAMTCAEQITNQGRITVPVPFRPLLGLEAGGDVVLVGCEVGVEVWSVAAWTREFAALREHEQRRAEAELAADLQAAAGGRLGEPASGTVAPAGR